MVTILEILLQYLEDPKEKMSRLKRKANDLESREDDIRSELNDVETSRTKKRKKSVENWLTRVTDMKAQILELEQKVERVWIFNRYQVSTAIDRVSTEVTELSQWPFPGGLTFEANHGQGLVFPTTELVGERVRAIKKMIHEILSNEEILSIGIYGMGGIGKSTLLTHLYNELLSRPNTFVVWVVASRDSSVKRLQNDIARALGVDLKNYSDEKRRAAMISRNMETKGNVIIILDDLWDALSLEKIGICVGFGCKMVFATRSSEVCDRIDCCLKVEMVPLNDEEAWTLFSKTLGNRATLSRQVEKMAKNVAKECEGLPLGIVTMAGSMRGVDDIHEWNVALNVMRSSHLEMVPHDNDQDGGNSEVEELQKVFRVLRHSYDALESKMTKECFLYCALFPKDCKIRRDDLVKYFVDEGLIQGMPNREAEFCKAHSILNKLERVCLLQGGPKWKYLKMHDLVRDMAIMIANEKCQFWVEAGLASIVDVGDNKKWSMKGLTRVSFVGRFLPDALSNTSSPRCPNIRTLLFRDCYNVTSIPDSFFEHMDTLTILDLSRTGISSLPSSVSNLRALTALLLGSCRKIEYVVPLSNLTALKRLDLSCTGIKELPEGMEMLTNLRELNLHGARSLRTIQEGTLSRLCQLQRLMLPKLKIGKTLAGEIASLKRLERFKAEYYNTNDLDVILKSWEKRCPNEFILLGDEVLCRDLYDVSDVAKYVSIKKCDGLRTLCELESLKNARGLKTSYVGECDRMIHLLCRGCYRSPFFQTIEVICLESLLSLSDLICEDGMCMCVPSSMSQPRLQYSGSFSTLKGFRIYKCPKMEKLFTPSLISSLKNLESLKVCDCDNLMEIVQDRQEPSRLIEHDYDSLPKLKLLKLWGLPKLKSLHGSKTIVSLSVQEIDISDCPMLASLPLVGDFPEFVPKAISRFATNTITSALKELTIKRCHNLKKLFTLTLPSCLQNLEKMVIHDCEGLVEIVQVTHKIDQEDNALPRLKVLKMQSLPRLERFCQSEKLVSDSIEEISIINCPNLRRFPLLREEANSPTSVRSVTVDEEWWDSIKFKSVSTRDILRPMCDFRHRFYGHVSHLKCE